MVRSRRVILLIDTSTSWGVRLIKGINQFALEVDNWLIHVEPRGRYERFRIPQGWQGDGVIARIKETALADQINAAKLPAMNVSWYPFEGRRIARCTVDERQSGQMAAEYFRANGFQHFAYCGTVDRPGYVDLFADAYRRSVEASSHDCHLYRPPAGKMRTNAWSAHIASLVKWLKVLPKPVAVLTWSAARGRQVTEACHYAGLRVPDQVAVLGGDYDDLMSNISNPPLSTIDQPAEQIGYAAAEMLEKMMSGEKPPAEAILFPPTRINVRHSTDILAIDEPLVRDALAMIREHAPHGIHVSDVVRELAVARRTLEQRFIELVGRTPAAEIRRVRIEEAKRLLVETDKSIHAIARATGFRQQDLLSRTFRRAVGLAPSEYRRQHHAFASDRGPEKTG